MESEKKYDDRFKSIDGLTWLPWVGKNYDKNRILIVAESHYGGETEFEADGSAKPDKEFTRRFVSRHADGENMWKMPNYLMRIICGGGFSDKEEQRKEFWENIAFYNHVQKLMRLATRQRPSKEDFRNGWDVFPEVVKILKPDYSLFIGLIASYSFNIKMQGKGLSYEPVSWMEKINGACPRRFSLTVDGHKTEIIGIRHTSGRISPNKWHDFLCKNWAEPLKRCCSDHQ